MQTANALLRLDICTGSSESSLLKYSIINKLMNWRYKYTLITPEEYFVYLQMVYFEKNTLIENQKYTLYI